MQHYLPSAGLDLLPVELGWPLAPWMMLSSSGGQWDRGQPSGLPGHPVPRRSVDV